MDDDPSLSAAWLTADGTVISPNAPAGGGGPGHFSNSGTTTGSPFPAELPDPQSPAARGLVPPDPDLLQASQPKDPPPTKPEIFQIKNGLSDPNNKNLKIDVKCEVKADRQGSGNGNEIDTKLDPSSLVASGNPQSDTRDPLKVIADGTLFTLVGTATIQVVYPQRILPTTTPPNWGRGTTETDKAAMNITVGFHESCHIADYKEFLLNNALPTFKGKIGGTVAAYNAAVDTFGTELQDYFGRAEAFSTARTDEVGRKKSDVQAGR